jgi:hypothetical protein
MYNGEDMGGLRLIGARPDGVRLVGVGWDDMPLPRGKQVVVTSNKSKPHTYGGETQTIQSRFEICMRTDI